MHTPPSSDVLEGLDSSAPVSREVGLSDSQSLRRVTMTTSTGIPIARTTWTGGTDPYIGAIIDGKYEVMSRLGEGGMGVVYQCRHTIIDRRVAMKVLRVDMAKNQEHTERFLNEARSASSIGNPHIIDILDFGQLPDGATYFLMEFLEGAPLTSLLGTGERLPPARLLNIAIQLTEALGAAHRAGIVHRDLKPDNVYLVERGSEHDFVKVLDFGIAKASTATNQLTQAGQVFGTPHYMSPEQAGGREVDSRADIYSLGIILYELVTGKLPFDGENFMSILTQHMQKDPPRFRDLGDAGIGIRPEFEAVVQRCLQKAPGLRYASMEDLGDDLRILLEGGTPSAFSSPLRSSMDSLLSNLGLSRTTSIYPHKSAAARSSLLVWAVGLGCVLLGAWLVFWLGGPTRSVPRAAAKPSAALPASAASSAPVVQPSEAAPEARKVALAVFPLDARVLRGDEDLGKSPIWLEVRGEPVSLKVERPGFMSQVIEVDGSEERVSIVLARAKEKLPKTPPTDPNSKAGSASKPTLRDGIIDPWKK
jgi:eukaryotic-like serine/threonine-protein kinase